MKQYQKLFIGLSLLTFISCGSSGGGGHDNPTNITPKTPVNGEVLKKGEVSTTPIVAESGETQISNGNTKINDKTKVAVMAENGGEITNGTDGTISGIFAVGIEATGTGSKVTNDGKVIGDINENIAKSAVSNYNQEVNRIGMEALNGGQAVNNGEISGKLSEGVIADGKGSTATNNGKVSSTGVKYNETFTDKDKIIHNETGITALGMGAFNGASVSNEKGGIIFGAIGDGIIAVGYGSTAINNGNISSTGVEYSETFTDKNGIMHREIGNTALGMRAKNGASAINKKDGIISGSITTGMKADGKDSSAVNDGVINIDGNRSIETYDWTLGKEHKYEEIKGRGMYSKEGGSVINNGKILGNISQGMKATGVGSTAINNGSIDIKGVEFIESFVNSKGILETTVGTFGEGMHAVESGTIINNGTININSENGIGMKASSGATAINEEAGIINLNSLDGTGMYATGEGSTIENRGVIHLSGAPVEVGHLTAEEIATSGEIINGKDSKGNIGMKIDSGARMINKGHIVFGK